jgi:hypothetical protein
MNTVGLAVCRTADPDSAVDRRIEAEVHQVPGRVAPM